MVDTNPDSNADPNRDPNLGTYNSPEVVEHYAALNYLSPCERLLFDEYLHPEMAILDLGVGGGRTTPYLSSIAASYVGVDYAPEMIAVCRKKFPALEFELGSAADLSSFAASSFHAVVMAFNALDYVVPDEARFRALQEIHRVLKPEGILIFSSHNPRSIWVRPSWNPKRVQDLAESMLKADSVLFRPLLWSLTAARIILAGMQTIYRSLGRVARRLFTRAFWSGEGYWMDPVHGGVETHGAAPREVTCELSRFGFRLLRALGDDYPLVSPLYITDWYYYVFSKSAMSGKK
jgi:SAM-dependent methyltransferase